MNSYKLKISIYYVEIDNLTIKLSNVYKIDNIYIRLQFKKHQTYSSMSIKTETYDYIIDGVLSKFERQYADSQDEFSAYTYPPYYKIICKSDSYYNCEKIIIYNYYNIYITNLNGLKQSNYQYCLILKLDSQIELINVESEDQICYKITDICLKNNYDYCKLMFSYSRNYYVNKSWHFYVI